jgi:two-component system phosphate regulon response regulator PhoB
MCKQVMVVDDEAGIRTLLSLMLKRRGFSVVTAGSAAEVLSLIEHTTPDLFVLDIMLTGTNGVELCRALRTNPRTRDSTILMLSARSDPESVSQSMQAGADDYLFKPVLQAALLDKVQRLIGVAQEACA